MTSVPSDMPVSIQECASKALAFASLGKDMKFNTFNQTYSNRLNITDNIYRKYNGETGQKTIAYIHEIIDQAIHLSKENPKYSDYLQETISQMRHALDNLYETYGDQPPIRANILILLTRIDKKNFVASIGVISENDKKNVFDD